MEDRPTRSSSASSSAARDRSGSDRRSASASGGATITREEYWRKQLRRIGILLAVWFTVGYVMSIFLAEPLNAINFGGIPFGFWMAQQGSIFVFISLILIYAISAGRLDKKAGVHEDDRADVTPPTDATHDKSEKEQL